MVTLNGEQFVEAARHLAQRALIEGGDTVEARANFIGLRLLSRPFRTEELEIIVGSFSGLAAYYEQHPEDAELLIQVGESSPNETLEPAELAAWTMLTNELMNLDEVLNK